MLRTLCTVGLFAYLCARGAVADFLPRVKMRISQLENLQSDGSLISVIHHCDYSACEGGSESQYG